VRRLVCNGFPCEKITEHNLLFIKRISKEMGSGGWAMKRKLVFITLLIITLVVVLCSGFLEFCPANPGISGSHIVLRIDKFQDGFATVQQYFHDASAAIFTDLGGAALVQKFTDQPVLFGGLVIFFGVVACCITFIVHLIRADVRF
jgi:hypothetical protein